MSDDKRILIVDDESNIRLVFQAALTGPVRHNIRR
jgi:DNA-binding NtrC family response regulator